MRRLVVLNVHQRAGELLKLLHQPLALELGELALRHIVHHRERQSRIADLQTGDVDGRVKRLTIAQALVQPLEARGALHERFPDALSSPFVGGPSIGLPGRREARS